MKNIKVSPKKKKKKRWQHGCEKFINLSEYEYRKNYLSIEKNIIKIGKIKIFHWRRFVNLKNSTFISMKLFNFFWASIGDFLFGNFFTRVIRNYFCLDAKISFIWSNCKFFFFGRPFFWLLEEIVYSNKYATFLGRSCDKFFQTYPKNNLLGKA